MSENPKVTMQVKANGSIRVTGDVDFLDADGNVIKSENGFSLCRCGHSANKPFAMALTKPLALKHHRLVK